MQKNKIELHPNEILLVASRATLGHTVSKEEHEMTLDTYSKLLMGSFNDPKKKDALHFQYKRQQAFCKQELRTRS